MRPDSRIILILGLGGDRESDFVQALADENDTLLLQAPFGTSFDMPSHPALSALPRSGIDPGAPLAEACPYFAGSPAVQSLQIENVGALQRAVEAIGARHGRLDVLILGSRVAMSDKTVPSAWQRLAQPYHFDGLAPIITCLPLLMKAPAARIIDLQAAGTEPDLSPLLAGTSVDVERVSLSPSAVDKSEDGRHQTAARDATRLTTLSNVRL